MSGGDRLDAVFALAHSLGFSDTEVRIRAAFRETRCATLADVLEHIAQVTGEPVAGRYPRGRRLVLDGQPESPTGTGFAGFGTRPYIAFTTAAVAPTVALVQRASAAGSQAQSRSGRRRPERSLGRGAAEHYVTAVHTIGEALVEHGMASRNPVEGVKAPPRATQRHPKQYDEDQVRDYVTAVLLNSSDPVGDALMWAFLRVSGCRRGGLLTVEVCDLDPATGRTILYRKGRNADSYVTALHRPLLRACLALEQIRRPTGAAPKQVFLNPAGQPVGRHHIQDWSKHLREHAEWATHRRLGVHGLRHGTAQAINAACRDPYAAAAALGHKPPSRYGATNTYLVDHSADPFPTVAQAVETTWGPLRQWPALPELDLLLNELPTAWRTL